MMRMSLRILVLLFMSTLVEGIEPTNCSSLVQRDAATRSRTSDVLEIANKEATWAALLQRHRQMLSTYLSDVERILAGQKPQSKSSWIMMTISVAITAVMLLGGCIILSRVHKGWNASVSGTQARSQAARLPWEARAQCSAHQSFQETSLLRWALLVHARSFQSSATIWWCPRIASVSCWFQNWTETR